MIRPCVQAPATIFSRRLTRLPSSQINLRRGIFSSYDDNKKNNRINTTTTKPKSSFRSLLLLPDMNGVTTITNNNRLMMLKRMSTVASSSSVDKDDDDDEDEKTTKKITETINSIANSRKPKRDKDKSIFNRLYDRYSIKGQQSRIRVAESFYQAALRQASEMNWFGPGKLDREFRQRHALITLHLWLLHKRLLADEYDPQVSTMLQEEIFNILWSDTGSRIRGQKGVREISVNRHLGKVQQYTFSHLFHYDHIYTAITKNAAAANAGGRGGLNSDHNNNYHQNDDHNNTIDNDDDENFATGNHQVVDFTKQEERIKELKKLVWIHFFQRKPEKNIDSLLDRMAWYIEAQYQNIMNELPDEYYRDGRIAWIPLPDFSTIGKKNHKKKNSNNNIGDDGDRETTKEEEEKIDNDNYFESLFLPKPWLSNITLRGDYYYWNPETKEATWEKPKEEERNSATETAPQ